MSKKHLCKITMLLGVICVISIVIECVQWLGKEKQIERAIQAYHEFISGERDVNGIDMDYISIPTGEPDKRYATKYYLLDVNRDDIPELHVRTGRDYFIFTYDDNELFVLQSYASSPAQYTLLENGFIIHTQYFGNEEYWECFQLDMMGNEIQKVTFSRVDENKDGYYDEKDEYLFNDDTCGVDEWLEKTERFLDIDPEGSVKIRNEIVWRIYCEMKW